jgi:hypothetical protein
MAIVEPTGALERPPDSPPRTVYDVEGRLIDGMDIVSGMSRSRSDGFVMQDTFLSRGYRENIRLAKQQQGWNG